MSLLDVCVQAGFCQIRSQIGMRKPIAKIFGSRAKKECLKVTAVICWLRSNHGLSCGLVFQPIVRYSSLMHADNTWFASDAHADSITNIYVHYNNFYNM